MINWLRTAGLRLLLALGLAFSLWVYVSFRENPNATTPYNDVPVEIENLAPGLVTVDRNGLPVSTRATVTVNAEGPANIMQTLRPSDIRAFADLSGLGPGEYPVPVNVATTRSGLARITFSTDPNFLPFRIEEIITRTVPLTIEVNGTVPFSFERLEAEASVNNQRIEEIEISGPANRVEQVSAVRATANVNQLTANYSSSRPVEPIDANGAVITGVTTNPSSVTVLVPIVSNVGIKRVPVIPQIIGSPAAGQIVVETQVQPEFVTLTGSSGPLDSTQNISTDPVDITGASGVITRTVSLRQPAGVALLENEPDSVTVTVRTAPINQPFSVTLPVEVTTENIGAGLLASLSPNIVQVELSGSAAQLSGLGAGTIQGTINLSGYGPGTYSLVPTFNLPRGVTRVNEPQVSVTVRAQPTAIPTPAPTATATPGVAVTEEPTVSGQLVAPAPTAEAPTPAEQPTAAP